MTDKNLDLSESQQQNTLRRVALIIQIAFREKKDTDTASAVATIKDRSEATAFLRNSVGTNPNLRL